MTTNSKQQPTKENPRKYRWIVFYTGVNQWGDTCVGRANVQTEADLLSADDSENTGLSHVEKHLKEETSFRSLSVTNIIERR